MTKLEYYFVYIRILVKLSLDKNTLSVLTKIAIATARQAAYYACLVISTCVRGLPQVLSSPLVSGSVKSFSPYERTNY